MAIIIIPSHGNNYKQVSRESIENNFKKHFQQNHVIP